MYALHHYADTAAEEPHFLLSLCCGPFAVSWRLLIDNISIMPQQKTIKPSKYCLCTAWHVSSAMRTLRYFAHNNRSQCADIHSAAANAATND
jgi:hypothetical protein